MHFMDLTNEQHAENITIINQDHVDQSGKHKDSTDHQESISKLNVSDELYSSEDEILDEHKPIMTNHRVRGIMLSTKPQLAKAPT